MKLLLAPVMGVLAAVLGAVPASGVHAQETPTADQLQAVARQLSERTPMMVDGETELTSVGAESGAIIYYFRLVNVEASAVPADKLEAAAWTAVTDKVCTNPQTRRNFLERGITMHYSYNDTHGQFLLSFDVTAADCGGSR